MLGFLKDMRWTPAALALIFFNLIPLIGVLQFNWDIGTIIFLYWLENAVIGVLNIPKILSAENAGHGRRETLGGRVFLAIFFSFHYGMFCLGHYAFLNAFFESVPSFPELLGNASLMIALAGLGISHTISMVVNFYGKSAYLDRSANSQMFMPYPRIVILHVVIIIGGGFMEAAGGGIGALIILIALKTVVDLVAHLTEHSKTDNLINPGVGAK